MARVPASAAPSTDRPSGWLVLVYRIPSEPTRLRASAWRRLKALGAVYLQNSVAAMPRTPEAERALRKLRHDIIGMDGTAVLFESSVLAGEDTVMSTYQSARTDEYEEIVDRCEGFLRELAKEWTAEHFTYAELEENEVDYTKLVNWFGKVSDRDVHGSPGRDAAVAALQQCEASLEEYATRVYAEEAEAH